MNSARDTVQPVLGWEKNTSRPLVLSEKVITGVHDLKLVVGYMKKLNAKIVGVAAFLLNFVARRFQSLLQRKCMTERR